jgi:hypothetical protein
MMVFIERFYQCNLIKGLLTRGYLFSTELEKY